jgi:hypothetical protein
LQYGVAHRVKYERRDGNTYTAENPVENPDPLLQVALRYSVAYDVGQAPTEVVQTFKGSRMPPPLSA